MQQDKKPCKCTKCQKEKRENLISKKGSPKDSDTPKILKVDKKEKRITKNAECHTSCNESVDVKVDVIPEVLLKQLKNNNRTSFEIELNAEAHPNCRVVKKEVYDPVNCRSVTKYVLLVESDVKLECDPIIKQISPKPSAKYEMDVIVDAKQNIKTKK